MWDSCQPPKSLKTLFDISINTDQIEQIPGGKESNMSIFQGRRRRSCRTVSAGPLFWTSILSAVSLFSRFGSFDFVLTSDFQFIDAIINDARCACHT